MTASWVAPTYQMRPSVLLQAPWATLLVPTRFHAMLLLCTLGPMYNCRATIVSTKLKNTLSSQSVDSACALPHRYIPAVSYLPGLGRKLLDILP